MAISIITGTAVGTTTGNQQTLSVSQPTLNDNKDYFMIGVVVNCATASAMTAPTNFTLVDTTPLSTSGTSSLYVFRRQGPATATSVSVTAPANNARMIVVPVLARGVDSAGVVDGSSSVAANLTAPSKTVTTGDMLFTFHGVREGTAPAGAAFNITAPSGMTTQSALYGTTAMDNETTNVGMRVSYLAVSTGSTGAKTATTDANAGYIGGSLSIVLNEAAAIVVPDAPVISGTAGNAQATINWTAPAANGSTITDYTLERKTGTGGTYAAIGASTITNASTSYNDTGLTNGTTYIYRLRAESSNGPSDYSSEVSVTPAAAGSGFMGYITTMTKGGPDHYYSLNAANMATDFGKAATKINGTEVTGNVTYPGTGSDAAVFDGASVLSFANSQDFSVTKTKQLTIMAYLTIDDYTHNPSPDYTHWMGKGTSNGNFEWQCRFYTDTSSSRPRRHSGYYYNLDPSGDGGLGSGAYSQPLPVGTDGGFNLNGSFNSSYADEGVEHIVFIQYCTDNSLGNAAGSIRLWWFDYATQTQDMDGTANIVPSWSSAPVRIGATNHGTFKGKVRRLAFWNRLLDQTEISGLVAQRALAEGSGGPGAPVAPDPPTSVVATRRPTDNSIIDVSWVAPVDNGGATISKYTASFSGGGITGSVDTPNGTTYTATLTGAPNTTTSVSVVAVNSAGPSTPATVSVPPAAVLPLIGALYDDFNSPTAGLTWTRSVGVTEGSSGMLEWATVDATHRAAYIRGDFRNQSAFFKMVPNTAADILTVFFVRSSSDRAKQIRIYYLNPGGTGGVLRGRVDDGSADATPSSKVYSDLEDIYWRVVDTGTSISLQSGPDGTTWYDRRTGIARPTWLNDVEVGIEVYTGTAV